MSARTTAVSPSSGCVTAAMTAGTAPTRQLTVVRSGLKQVQEVSQGETFVLPPKEESAYQ